MGDYMENWHELYTLVVVASAVHRDAFASLFICQRFSLLHLPMRTKAIFDDIQSYSVLDFPSSKPPLNSKRKTNKSRKSATCPPSWKFQVSLSY